MKKQKVGASLLGALAKEFRRAIEDARDAGEFYEDHAFYQFPTACCGDTSCLLGQYLLDHGIASQYVCGNSYCGHKGQSHAWLQVEDVIIDITGDQFKSHSDFLFYDDPAYVGKIDAMHRLFEVCSCDMRNTVSLKDLGPFAAPRLVKLYDIIRKYIGK